MELGVRRLEMEMCGRTKCQSLLEGRSSFIPFSLPFPNPYATYDSEYSRMWIEHIDIGFGLDSSEGYLH